MVTLIWLTAVGILLVLLLFGLLSYLLYSALIHYHSAPFVPASRQRVRRMLELAQASPGDRVADLGSGDGRIVIAFAKHGVKADGFELHPHLVWYSRILAWLKGVSALTTFHRQDIFDVDYSNYQIVTLYVFPSMMSRLETKLQRELPVGAKVLSLAFPFPNWQPVDKHGSIYVYEKGKS